MNNPELHSCATNVLLAGKALKLEEFARWVLQLRLSLAFVAAAEIYRPIGLR